MDELDRMLERWEAGGIISASQAERIRAAEAPARPARRIPLVAEVLGYLGTAFVLSAAAALMTQLWEDLGIGGRVLVLGLVTVLLSIAGSVVRNSREPAIHRLASLLWLAAVAGAGATSNVVVVDGLGIDTGFAFPTGLAMSALGLALWLLRRSALQLIGLFAGLVVLCTGISDLMGGDDAFGILLFVLGVAALVPARLGMLQPQRSAYALSSGAMIVGAQWTAVEIFADTEGWALVLGMTASLSLLGVSVAWRSAVLLGFGTAGAFLFLPQIVDQYLGDTFGNVAVLLGSGLALLGAALLAVRLRDRVSG
jgi:hypothetical protein